jgi:hypothetical protein
LAAVGDLARALASVSAAVDVGTRGFTYHDGLSANLRPYSGALAPAFSVHGEVYPLAASSQGFGRNIGLVADYRAAVDLSSRPASGSTVETSWVGYDVLLRVRIPFGTNAPRVLGVFAGYAREEFVFAIPVKSYPSAAYPSVRAGVDVRVPFGQSAITLAGDYDAVLSVEYVGTNFRAPAVGGVDASVTYGYRIASVLEVFAQGSMSRYFYSFGPKPGDAWVAGGAVDQMFHGQLGVRATY